MSNDWTKYSPNFPKSYSKSVESYLIFCLVVCSILIYHSYRVHKLKRHYVRIYTDVTSTATLIACILLISAKSMSGELNATVAVDFIVYGMCLTTVKFIDTYVNYSIYKTIENNKTPKWKTICILSFIWIFAILTAFPYVSIIPIFVNTNTKPVVTVRHITSHYVLLGAFVLYDIYFGIHYWRIMRVEKSVSVIQKGNYMLIIAVKNMLRIILSLIGIVLLAIEESYDFIPVGCITYCLLVTVALHVLFNWKIEKASRPIKEFSKHLAHASRKLSQSISRKLSVMTIGRRNSSVHFIVRDTAAGARSPHGGAGPGESFRLPAGGAHGSPGGALGSVAGMHGSPTGASPAGHDVDLIRKMMQQKIHPMDNSEAPSRRFSISAMDANHSAADVVGGGGGGGYVIQTRRMSVNQRPGGVPTQQGRDNVSRRISVGGIPSNVSAMSSPAPPQSKSKRKNSSPKKLNLLQKGYWLLFGDVTGAEEGEDSMDFYNELEMMKKVAAREGVNMQEHKVNERSARMAGGYIMKRGFDNMGQQQQQQQQHQNIDEKAAEALDKPIDIPRGGHSPVDGSPTPASDESGSPVSPSSKKYQSFKESSSLFPSPLSRGMSVNSGLPLGRKTSNGLENIGSSFFNQSLDQPSNGIKRQLSDNFINHVSSPSLSSSKSSIVIEPFEQSASTKLLLPSKSTLLGEEGFNAVMEEEGEDDDDSVSSSGSLEHDIYIKKTLSVKALSSKALSPKVMSPKTLEEKYTPGDFQEISDHIENNLVQPFAPVVEGK